MRLTIVGCGDAFGSGGRFNTCFKIDAKQAAILLDCGASSLVALKARQFDLNVIDAIMLSHLHGDHFGGLPFLLLDAQLLSRRTRPLVIAGPPGTRTRLDAALEVRLVQALDANTYQFDHALTQQALYQELSPRRRARRHLHGWRRHVRRRHAVVSLS